MRLTGFDLPTARLTLRAWASDLATPAERTLPPVPAGQTLTSGKLTFLDVRTEALSWKPLLDYLAGRGISWRLLQQSQRTQAHLQQIFYRTAGSSRQQPYFGLAWKTEAGWEVRNPRFQGTIGGKGLTWLPGQERREIAVFEGFMDYLSALTYYGRAYFACTVLVLNSVSLLSEALPRCWRPARCTGLATTTPPASGPCTCCASCCRAGCRPRTSCTAATRTSTTS